MAGKVGVVSTSPAPSAATPSSNGMSLNSQGGPRPNPGKPLPNARSRWKKITGTAMFINKLGKIECRFAAKNHAVAAKDLAAAAVSKISQNSSYLQRTSKITCY